MSKPTTFPPRVDIHVHAVRHLSGLGTGLFAELDVEAVLYPRSSEVSCRSSPESTIEKRIVDGLAVFESNHPQNPREVFAWAHGLHSSTRSPITWVACSHSACGAGQARSRTRRR